MTLGFWQAYRIRYESSAVEQALDQSESRWLLHTFMATAARTVYRAG